MNFQPCNRYILIERKISPTTPVSLIELPEGSFTSHEPHHEKVYIKAIAPGVRPPIAADQHAIVLSHMIEEVSIDGATAYLVLENHILGIVTENQQ
tara:strand:- start:186 stop:473 length:288 start_codon:yes stop_codon:yes gene_type:complete